MKLEGKRVLITGASSGIGYAAAKLMAEEGADIAFTYCQNRTNAMKLQEEIEGIGRKVICCQTDMTVDEDVIKLAEIAESELGPIDILVNNAGSLVERMPFFAITRKRWDQIMDLNLWSVLLLSQQIGAKMKERGGGVIINNASVAGRFGGAGGALAYGVSKGALITMTQAMGKELIADGIRVNALAPGVIDTPFHDQFTSPEMMKSLMARIPIQRAGTAEEMAKIILFLATEDSAYLIGATIDANGGMWVI